MLLNTRDVAAMLQCSPRTVQRLAASGRMPRPVRLGRLARWSRPAIEVWIGNGCRRPEGKETAPGRTASRPNAEEGRR